MTTGLVVFLAVWAWLMVAVLVRNGQVYRYLIALLDRVSEAGKRDIEAGRPWEWRYEIMHAVPQERMTLEFWRPLRSYGLERAAEEG